MAVIVTRVKTFFIRNHLNWLAFSSLVVLSQRGDTNLGIKIDCFANFLAVIFGGLILFNSGGILSIQAFKQSQLQLLLPHNYTFRC